MGKVDLDAVLDLAAGLVDQPQKRVNPPPTLLDTDKVAHLDDAVCYISPDAVAHGPISLGGEPLRTRSTKVLARGAMGPAQRDRFSRPVIAVAG